VRRRRARRSLRLQRAHGGRWARAHRLPAVGGRRRQPERAQAAAARRRQPRALPLALRARAEAPRLRRRDVGSVLAQPAHARNAADRSSPRDRAAREHRGRARPDRRREPRRAAAARASGDGHARCARGDPTLRSSERARQAASAAPRPAPSQSQSQSQSSAPTPAPAESTSLPRRRVVIAVDDSYRRPGPRRRP
jgi:hypothetical protein